MSKERFVGFYLSAMMKAATGGRVSKITYQDTKEYDVATVTFADGASIQLPIFSDDLLGIALEVVKAVQGL